jgi:hypothetical protein
VGRVIRRPHIQVAFNETFLHDGAPATHQLALTFSFFAALLEHL